MPQSNSAQPEQIWVAIPVFNNCSTIKTVAAKCRSIIKNVVVVDDGSTDADIGLILQGLDIVLLKHDCNFGKGQAILTASRYIEQRGGLYMITIDADGQHDPEDIEKFLPLMQEDASAIVIGSRNFNTENVPASSRFGRKFANFWLKVETGVSIDDCQSGFRAYPVRHLNRMTFKGTRYDFEAEVLAKAAWAGLSLKTVPVRVRYPKAQDRISSFKPFLDNLRLTRIHSMLVGRRLLPVPHKKLVKKTPAIDLSLLRHPGKALKLLLQENATPEGLAMSAAVGVFFGVLPLLTVHSIVILYVSLRLNLNKVVALNVQHIAMPPFVPAVCIEVGYYLRHGRWLTNLSFATVFNQFSARLFEWFLGSLIVAPLAALLIGAAVFVAAALIKKIRYTNA